MVDDDPTIRDLLVDALEGEGYVVASAANGAEALEQAAKTAPDAILLDLMMPVMDGWTFARQFGSNGGSATPIVVLSAARELPDAAEALKPFGVRACLAKPFDLDALLALVERFARRAA